MTTPATVRSRVRVALDRAWAAAEAAGTLPAHPGDVPRPSVEVERPAKPEHGDLATNLAMKLARPLRRPPLAIATAIVEALATSATDPASPTGPLAIGNARGAFVGDLLCRVLAAGGQQVTREYYFNDSGGQIDRLGA